MDLDSIWNALVNYREAEEIFELPETIIIPNSFRHIEYRITHRFKNSTSAFIGFDNENQKFHIKIFGVPSFNEVKLVYKNLKIVNKHSSELQIIKVVDVFEFYENERWVVLLVTPYFEGFTIEELTEAFHKNDFHLAKDSSISIFLSILEIIKAADSKGLILSPMPDNLFFVKGKQGILNSSQSAFELKILATSLQWLISGKSHLERLYPINQKRNHVDGMIWGAGLALYAFVAAEPLSTLPCLNDINDIERGELLKFYYKDEALGYILKNSLKNNKPSNFNSHPIIKLWTALINDNWEGVVLCQITQLSLLLSGLTFEKRERKFLALKRLLLISKDNSTEVCLNLSKNDLLFTFVDICLIFDWNSKNVDLLNSVFMVLKDKLTSRTIKEKLVSMSFYKLVHTAILLKANNDILCDFILKFFDDNTLTILQIVWTSGFLDALLVKPNKSLIELNFIKGTIPYYGINSVDIIKRVYESIEISEVLVNQYLLEIPYYFKSENSHQVVQIMQKTIERNARSQGDSMDMLKTIVLNLAEILCVPKLFQYHHILNQCTSLSNKVFLSDLGRNPLLIKCRNCLHSFCSICKGKSHETHDYQFVLYQNPLFRCHTSEPSSLIDPDFDILIFQLPRFPIKMTFVDSYQNEYKPNTSRFIGSSSYSLSTIEAIKVVELPSPATLIYFEVKVLQAGYQENIEIGVDGSGVTYRGCDGAICVNGKQVSKGPRFGSYDTVGIGVTSNEKAYVTYNGLINWPMVDCKLMGELKPLIILNSEMCEIDVQLRNWLFQPTDDKSQNQDFVNKDVLKMCEELLLAVCRYVKKSFSKNPKDNKAKDLMDRYIEILKAVKRMDLVAKTEVKKSKYWGRL